MKRKVLIIGGSYFIGKKISDILTSEFEVTVLNRGTKKSAENVETIICDRNDFASMKNSLKGRQFDFIVDVSGTNAEQSKILCESLDCSNLKAFLFISSSAVYDVEHLNIPFVENDNLAENKYWTYYGRNKIEAESYLQDTLGNTNTNLYILRPPYVYGENNYAQRESFIFEHLLTNKPIIIPNDGNTKLQFIYTTDLANIVKTLLNSDIKGTNIYNVGNKSTVTVNEWIQNCAEAVGCKYETIEFNYKSQGFKERDFFPFFDYDNVLDVTKINQVYNYETPFVDGLKNALTQFLKDRNNIVFKPFITENEEKILKLLKWDR